MLHFSDGQPFTTGGAAFGYRAITGTGETPRLLLQVSIEGILTEAIVDTGGALPRLQSIFGKTPKARFGPQSAFS
jgi:hypothetical protein